jgi:hypothetical protein
VFISSVLRLTSQRQVRRYLEWRHQPKKLS